MRANSVLVVMASVVMISTIVIQTHVIPETLSVFVGMVLAAGRITRVTVNPDGHFLIVMWKSTNAALILVV